MEGSFSAEGIACDRPSQERTESEDRSCVAKVMSASAGLPGGMAGEGGPGRSRGTLWARQGVVFVS